MVKTLEAKGHGAIEARMKPGWRVVRFDEMAQLVNDRVDNPAEAGVERYVGLEHLDPESLKIRRWGAPTDVEAQKLRFQPGDIIFGKRRAYQRKLAVADFEGICSAHAMVLRAREETVIKDFLPFFMQSDIFFDRALAISVGSLSPTINWKTLASQQFAIPPKDEQSRIASILWAADEVAQLYKAAVMHTETAFETFLYRLMKHGLGDSEIKTREGVSCPAYWEVKPLEHIAVVDRGKFAHRPRNLPRFYGGSYPFVQTGDIASARGLLVSFEQTLSEEGRAISRSFPPGSILMTIAAIIGKTAVTTFEVWCTDSVVGIVPSKEIDVYFLEFYLRTTQKQLDEKTASKISSAILSAAESARAPA